jgi:histone H3/H4
MQNLVRANRELFRRTPDETYPSLEALVSHCRRQREDSTDHWISPTGLWTRPVGSDGLLLAGGEDKVFQMNDWSFGQLCRLAGVTKETVNRLSPDTASRVFAETLPRGNKPLQVFATGEQARSIHGASYTRLHNDELLHIVLDCVAGFEPPPKGSNGGTGLYCGEQDMFLFLIDPTGWTEIGGETFAPGLFLWNSEVGRRSLGVETFWFQAICQNHLVWDPVEVIEFSRKHTANVHEALAEIRRIIETLAGKRDQRRDAFARVIQRAMDTKLAKDADEVRAALSQTGISRALAREAIELAQQQGRFTVFTVVDALTRLSRQIVNAGDRTEVDQQAGRLLALAV